MTRRPRRLRAAIARAIDTQRAHLARAEALPQLAVLGIGCGLLAALLMIAFRATIDLAQALLLPPGPPENFGDLAPHWRVALPVAGGALVGLGLLALPAAARQVGVVHVMERLAYHRAAMPLRNAIVQFVAAAACLASGLSVGREGPAIHLGAATASLAGRFFGLPDGTLRVLVGCGAAAAIAASFNTPLAGVVFAMEVVLMEYTVVGFAPVILAAVCATGLIRAVHGSAPAFAVPAATLQSLWELPLVAVLGLACGLLAAAFVAISGAIARRTTPWPVLLRMVLAGGLSGVCGLAVPEVMGLGYRTVSDALNATVPLATLAAIVALKLVASAGAVGLGVPAGLIGPVLVIGAAAGGSLGLLGAAGVPAELSSPGYYALLGLGAMMAGTLHAPLAALTAMLELTGNPDVVLPGMLTTITAYGVSRVWFRQESVFVTLMRARGLDYRSDPLAQSLRRVGVAVAADDGVAVLPSRIARAAIEPVLAGRPNWIVVADGPVPSALLPAVDLALHLADPASGTEIDLAEMPARRLQFEVVPPGTTLQQALDAVRATGAEALCVGSPGAPQGAARWSVVTRSQLERSYRYER